MRSFGLDKKRARESLSALLIALVILVFSGCATTGLYTSPDKDEAREQGLKEKQGAPEELRVTSIDVLGEGDSVLIATNRAAQYTSFTLTSPLRLVVDLPEANLYDVLDSTKVNNKYLKTINIVTYGGKEKIGRIILELQEGVDHEVKTTEEGVLIRLKRDPMANMPEGSIEDEAVVVASSGKVTVAENQAGNGETADDVMEPATTVEELQSFTRDTETVIQIISDGSIGKYNTFELSDPARVVIDVWDVTNKTGLKTLLVDEDHIKDVRIGNHPDKVRFVIDIESNEIPPYVITRTGDHITATFNPAVAEGSDDRISNDEGDAASTTEEGVSQAADEGGEAAPEDSAGADEGSLIAEDYSGDEGSTVGLSNVAFDAGGTAIGDAGEVVAAEAEEGAGAVTAETETIAGDGPEAITEDGAEAISEDTADFTGDDAEATEREFASLSGSGEDTSVTAEEGGDTAYEDVSTDSSDVNVAMEDSAPVTEDSTGAEVQAETGSGAAGAVLEGGEVVASAAQAGSAVATETAADGTVAVAEAASQGTEAAIEEGASVNPDSDVESAPEAVNEAPEVVAAADTPDTALDTGAEDATAEEDVSGVIEDTGAQIDEAAKAQKEAEREAATALEEDDNGADTGTPAVEVQDTPRAVVAGNTVKNIGFRKMDNKGFLTIETTGKPVYTIKESKDKKTLVLDISDALIREDLVRTLDATRLNTPVATVSSYQSSRDPAVTRVLVSLSGEATHSVMELDGTLNVIFAPAERPAVRTSVGEVQGESILKTPSYTGKRIDLDMMDARVTDILRLLAEVSNLNIIASDDVQGTISLRLRDVPWDQAFDIILKAKGLDKVQVGNVIRVAPAARISQERDAALASQKASEKLEPLSVEFVAINYAKAEELEAHVKNVLSDRGSVTSEARTNTLIIKDIKKGIKAAETLVSRLDTPIPQVLIEARIVEASSSFSRDLGIQWGVDFQTGGNVSTDLFGSGVDSQGLPAGGQTPPSTTTTPTFQQRSGVQDFAVNLPATGSIGTLGALGFVLGKAGQNPLILDLRLSAGEQEGQLRTISRPRVVTMDNKEAKIEDGESVPFETTSASGTSTIFIDANLSLTVTPHITPDGSVLMKIKASKNSIGTFTTSSGEPSIVKKEASTEVLVRDGETTVIGGIISSDSNHTNSGIPYLKDIPLLGKLFQSKSTTESQKELLIFITPSIIKTKAKRTG